MSFDMRQNVLMVRSLIKGQPFYYFYNAEGLEFSLSGYQLKEIYDCHFEGRMAAITTYWGFSNKPNYESFEFAENGDLLWHVSLNATCSTLLPLEMINGHEGFNVINGFMIDDHKRTVMKIHQKAVGRSVERLTWFRDMSEERMRELLCSLGHGPMRIERADREELIKIHRDWQRKHDEDFKYTHNACGVDPDDKLPADLYDDHGKWLRQRHMAKGKTLEMMASELANLVRVFDLYIGDDDFDHMNPDWDEGLLRVAQAFIYGPNAKERFEAVKYDPQFVVNGIYALAKDLNWIHVNEESQDYKESLIRRLMQELKNEVERPDGVFVVEDGIVMLKATSATADTDVVDEVEEDEAEAERVPRKFPASRSPDTYDYVRIRKVLVWLKLPTDNMSRRDADCSRVDVEKNRKKAVSVLRNAVKEGKLDTLKEIHLKSLALALTKMKDGDRYPRDAEYLKELIKHALR